MFLSKATYLIKNESHNKLVRSASIASTTSGFSRDRRSVSSSFIAEKSRSTLTWVTGSAAKMEQGTFTPLGYERIASHTSFPLILFMRLYSSTSFGPPDVFFDLDCSFKSSSRSKSSYEIKNIVQFVNRPKHVSWWLHLLRSCS
jgi:hypothetical protein